MNINPSYETIGSVFEKNILLEVPKYQRYYAWDDEQVDDFIKDISNVYSSFRVSPGIEHFFGGIVVVKKDVAGSNRQQRELIDGQQRITTTILLFISVFRKFESLKTSENEEIIQLYIDKLTGKYLLYKDQINRRPINVSKLVLSNADRQYFENIVLNHPLEENRDSHQKLKKAFKKLRAYVDQTIDPIPDVNEKIDALSDFDNIIHNNCTIIFIDADSREAAYKLFQVLNDRGAGLTEGDLLKSKTLEVLEQHFSVRQEALQNSWDEILQDDPKQVETFLRYYYASVCGSRVGRTTLYDEFLKRFFPAIVDKDNIVDESEAISLCDEVTSILNEMRIYRKIISGDWPYEIEQPVGEWDRRRLFVLVNYLNFDIVYPLLMAASKLEQKKFADIVYMVEKFMFRHKSVCNLGHQKLSELYMKEAVKIRQNPSEYRVSSLSAQLRDIITRECTDEVFRVGLTNLKYRPNGGNKQLKYLFSMLTEHERWFAQELTGRPTVEKTRIINYENITIEHIDAQSPAGEALFQGEAVHKLKNLTLLTPRENDHAANKIYLDKKSIYVNSEYTLNLFFENVASWDMEASLLWEKHLIDMACKIFVV